LAQAALKIEPEMLAAFNENAEEIARMERIVSAAKYCIMIVATVPVVLLYSSMQKFFEKGVMIGSLKG